VSSSEPTFSTPSIEQQQAAEIQRLRSRISELEARLVEVEDWANRAVGAAQERLYWLDRWRLDLNQLMERPGASELRAAVRAVRAVYRALVKLRRSLRSEA